MCKSLQSQKSESAQGSCSHKKVKSQKIIMLELCHLTKRPLPLVLCLIMHIQRKGLRNEERKKGKNIKKKEKKEGVVKKVSRW
jgi:hypothetical protein